MRGAAGERGLGAELGSVPVREARLHERQGRQGQIPSTRRWEFWEQDQDLPVPGQRELSRHRHGQVGWAESPRTVPGTPREAEAEKQGQPAELEA